MKQLKIILLASMVILFTACGGGGSSPGGDTPPSTNPQIIAIDKVKAYAMIIPYLFQQYKTILMQV